MKGTEKQVKWAEDIRAQKLAELDALALVFGHGGPHGLTPCIYRDKGWYEGTIKRYNIRKVEAVEMLEFLDDEKVKQTLCGKNAEYYGSRRGGGRSALFPITNPAAIAALKCENNQAKTEAERSQAEAERQAYQRCKALERSGICPRCGSWCHGDCEDN